MSGDLEDFLRRAAERRQAKAAEQQQPAATKRSPPQYSDSRRERLPQAQEADEVLAAEIVVEPEASNSFANRMQRVEEAKHAAAEIEAEIVKKTRAKSRGETSVDSIMMSGDVAEDLVRMLKKPGGIRNAILLREIFDRPEHRW
ncbi:MAG: hypothetical protein ACR2NZ_15675 [Rubripirellula sp.]